MNLTVAVTGASGAILGRELLRVLEADERVERVHLWLRRTRCGWWPKAEPERAHDLLESCWTARRPNRAALRRRYWRGDCFGQLSVERHDYPALLDGTLAAIANGLANSLIARAADVTLKERRPLICACARRPSTAFISEICRWPPRRER